jgi:hypothetical protein
MIHFDFIVDDFEAESIFDAIQAEIVQCHVRLLDEKPQWPEQIEWFEARIKFLEDLKKKMTNSRV